MTDGALTVTQSQLRSSHTVVYVTNRGGSTNFKGGGAEDNLSAPSSFISNAHNEIYAFYTKKRFFNKNVSQ